jgi:hypothetical protein
VFQDSQEPWPPTPLLQGQGSVSSFLMESRELYGGKERRLGFWEIINSLPRWTVCRAMHTTNAEDHLDLTYGFSPGWGKGKDEDRCSGFGCKGRVSEWVARSRVTGGSVDGYLGVGSE